MLLLKRALSDERGLGKFKVEVDDETLRFIAERSGGDARRALNALEAAFLIARETEEGRGEEGSVRITLSIAQSVLSDAPLAYQRTGDDHYDVASAFIKSIRGSDPDAAVYWLARFLASGEDPRFIARRMVIAAAEDIGLADPMALVIAVAAAQAVEIVGMPEAQIRWQKQQFTSLQRQSQIAHTKPSAKRWTNLKSTDRNLCQCISGMHLTKALKGWGTVSATFTLTISPTIMCLNSICRQR